MKLFINCDDNDITFNKKNYLLRAAERLGFNNVVDLKSRKEAEPTDYILNIEPFGFVRGNKWTGVWEIDLLCERPETGRDWPASDSVFVAGSIYPGDRTKPILLLQACDPVLHRRTKEPTFDIVQCGSGGAGGWYNERNRLLEILKEKYSFKDFGKNFKPQEYVDNISQARVQFIRSMQGRNGEGEIAQRFFECLAIGPVLTNWVDDLSLTGLIEGRDYMAYRDDKELLEKMELLISSPELRDSIANSGRKKAVLFHSYENRLISIMNEIYESTGR